MAELSLAMSKLYTPSLGYVPATVAVTSSLPVVIRLVVIAVKASGLARYAFWNFALSSDSEPSWFVVTPKSVK